MIAIQFENVGKLYRLGTVGTGTLSHDLNRWWKTRVLHQEDPYLKIGEVNDRATHGDSDYVWALKDISFSVEEGDVVGIIGKNGAGKSTLLKLLSQITSPTTGVIRARGRIGSLLEVGTGFHPEMTGRENIYMNGSIMGMTRQEITRKLDEIIDFAGVARYIDTPVKRYSSGMTVRLGFAVAAFMEPEILVVDEVLAVGDAEFQKKAIGKMQDVSRGDGRSVLFVSHNMAAVRSLCHKGIVLKDGLMDFSGTSEEAIDHYLKEGLNKERKLIIDSIVMQKDYIKINEISINNTPYSTTVLYQQQHLDIVIKCTTLEPIQCEVKLTLKRLDGTPMATLAEGRYKDFLYKFAPGEFTIIKRIRLPKYIGEGHYQADLCLLRPKAENYFVAKNCIFIDFNGYYDQYANPLRLSQDGFLGLESE
jgi:lipopolysaccharide transport system ATP-binding protein